MYPAQTVVALESRGIKLTWYESETAAVIGYEVYAKEGGSTDFRKINQELIPQTEFVTPELPVGRNYSFKIRAVDDNGNFSDSDEFSIYLP